MYLLELRTCMDDPYEGKGSLQGQTVRVRLESLVSRLPTYTTFGLSLEGIGYTDSVFARVAVLELAVLLRRQKAFYLLGVEAPDLLENWDNAARRCSQPLYVWERGIVAAPLPVLLGPPTRTGETAMLAHVLRQSSVSASDAARNLHLHIQNASNKLRSLWEQGYILREERCASSGGREYTYAKIV
jgi:hypothetical protein